MPSAKHDVSVTMGMDTAAVQAALDRVSNQISTAVSGFKKIAVAATGAFAGLFAVSEIKSGIESIINFGAELDKLSRQTGISVSDIEQFRIGMMESGLSASASAEGLKDLRDSMFYAGLGSTHLQQSLQLIGVRFADIRRVSPVEQFKAIATAINKVVEPTHRLTLAQAILGKTLGNVAATMRPEQLAGVGQSFGPYLAAQSKAAPHFAAIAASIARITEAFKAFFAIIVGKVAPVIQQIAERVEKMAAPLLAAAAKLGEKLKQYFNALNEAMKAGKLGEFLTLSISIATGVLLNKLVVAAKVFWEVMKSAVPAFGILLWAAVKAATSVPATRLATSFHFSPGAIKERWLKERTEQLIIGKFGAQEMAKNPLATASPMETAAVRLPSKYGDLVKQAIEESKTVDFEMLSKQEKQLEFQNRYNQEFQKNTEMMGGSLKALTDTIVSLPELVAQANKETPLDPELKEQIKRLTEMMEKTPEVKAKTEPMPGQGLDVKTLGKIFYQPAYDEFRRIGGGAGLMTETTLSIEEKQLEVQKQIAKNTEKLGAAQTFDAAMLRALQETFTPRTTEEIIVEQTGIEKEKGAASIAQPEWRRNVEELARRELQSAVFRATAAGEDSFARMDKLAAEAQRQFQAFSDYMSKTPVRGAGETTAAELQIERERLRLRAEELVKSKTRVAAVAAQTAAAGAAETGAPATIAPPAAIASVEKVIVPMNREEAAGRGVAPDFMAQVMANLRPPIAPTVTIEGAEPSPAPAPPTPATPEMPAPVIKPITRPTPITVLPPPPPAVVATTPPQAIAPAPDARFGAQIENALNSQLTRITDFMQQVANNTAETVRLLTQLVSKPTMPTPRSTMMSTY
jgi:hypothetical protein